MATRAGRPAISLLIGIALTIGIAWGCAAWSTLNTWDFPPVPRAGRWSRPGGPLGGGVRLPGDWEPETWLVERGVGLRYELLTEMPWIGSRLAMMTGRGNRTFEWAEAGWPLTALAWDGSADTRFDDARSRTWWRIGAPGVPGGSDRLFLGVERRLPIRPVWPGFYADVLVYAAAVWTVMVAASGTRRSRRRRRGLCQKCGYDLRGVQVCPECGGKAFAGAGV